MDSMIKKRMREDILVYRCLGIVDGDKTFEATPTTLKGYVAAKSVVFITERGVEVRSDTTVYLNGIHVGDISVDDEIETSFIKRRSVKRIVPYSKIQGDGYELLEVLI